MNLLTSIKTTLSLVAISLSFSAAATEKLLIEQDSPVQFTGSYQADQHLISFDTKLHDQAVSLKIDIDGKTREAQFDLASTDLQLTVGTTDITKAEQELLYDTAKTLVDYLNRIESHQLNDHLVVLVGVMNDWHGASTIH